MRLLSVLCCQRGFGIVCLEQLLEGWPVTGMGESFFVLGLFAEFS